jgi:hypothetical protein
MPLCKLLGGVLLVGGATGASTLYRAYVTRQLACVCAWRALLLDLRQTIVQTGAAIGEWLRAVRQNSARLAPLGVPPDALPSDPASGTAGLRVLCCAAPNLLPPSHPATKSLMRLADTMEELRDRQAAVQALEALDGQLAELEQQTQQTLRQTCRAVQALCLCGALAVTILLW